MAVEARSRSFAKLFRYGRSPQSANYQRSFTLVTWTVRDRDRLLLQLPLTGEYYILGGSNWSLSYVAFAKDFKLLPDAELQPPDDWVNGLQSTSEE